ncbi:probable G-protein coupled receptor No18 [Strongylocentrotus purpuratus]|uniref:G-protein coupled receptors family 1 profile domain-containing protein n=1 Tax=Strongylocentrotus purpuratus TaxID=7668 RepID=A0A7M7LLM6_STRPU|nr:probable G-protein coupled receptor No18 [Strongylocentrotus purpuratus]
MAIITNRSSDTDIFVFEDYNQRIAIATFLCIVFVVGSIGNTLVITAVVLSRKLRSSTNWFVVNLSCCDLLICLCLPFNVVAMLSRDGWPLPGWICAANSAMAWICLGASVMTLALIAFNRWYLLTKSMMHFQTLYTTRNICFMLLSAWMYPALLCLLPHFAGLGRLGYSNNFKACAQDNSIPTSFLYSLIAGACAIMPAFIVMGVIYVRIYLFVSGQRKKMKQLRKSGAPQMRGIDNVNMEISSSEFPSTKRSTLTPEENITQSRSTSNLETSQTTETDISNGEGKLTAIENLPKNTPLENSENQSRQSPKSTEANQKRLRPIKQRSPDNKADPHLNNYNVTVTKRLAVVVLAFVICLLPFTVSVLIPSSNPGIPWTGLMLTFNSCVNPLIYTRTMPEFRKVMLAIIRCRLKDITEPIACIRRFR